MTFDFGNIKESKEAEGIIGSVYDNYRRGLLNVIKVIGLPGTGKSWSCMRLAEMISIRIHKEDRITIKNVIKDLLGLVEFLLKAKEGDIMILEEVSALFPSRRAMSSENVDATRIFDTMRKKRIILLMNCPLSKSVDSHLTALSTLEIQTIALNKKEGICIVKPLEIQTNPSMSKPYYHRLYDLNGDQLDFTWTGRPKESLTQPYEGEKDAWLNKYHTKIKVRAHDRDAKEDKAARKLEISENIIAVPIFVNKEQRNEWIREQRFVNGRKIKDIAMLAKVSDDTVFKVLNKPVEKPIIS